MDTEKSAVAGGIGIPILISSDLEKICHSIIKYQAGYFKKKKFVLSKAKKGTDEIKDPVLVADVAKHIEPTDIAIICKFGSQGGKNNFNWCFLFLLDSKGVRKALKASWGWRVFKARTPFDKRNYNDTAFRRREQTTGEGKDMEFVYKGSKAVFVRLAAQT